MGNHACKRADVHITNDNMKCTKLVLETLVGKMASVSVLCCFLVDYTISVYMMITLHPCTLCDVFT